jgi:hypothetical protein
MSETTVLVKTADGRCDGVVAPCCAQRTRRLPPTLRCRPRQLRHTLTRLATPPAASYVFPLTAPKSPARSWRWANGSR